MDLPDLFALGCPHEGRGGAQQDTPGSAYTPEKGAARELH